jgi:sigma-B regulation protein RsbU (phosphoserine phosphatase)
MMAAQRIRVLRRSTVAAVAALALAAVAFAVALVSAADSHGTDHRLLLGALIAMIVVVVTMTVGIIVAVSRGLLRPFRELNRSVAAVAQGRFGTRIPAVGPAELADLSRGIELMRTRLVAALEERECSCTGTPPAN